MTDAPTNKPSYPKPGRGIGRLTQTKWREMLVFFMKHPGQVKACAEACGIDIDTARRGWRKGWKLYTWENADRPMRELVDGEREKAEQARIKREWEAAEQAEMAKREAVRKAAIAREVEEEAARLSTAAMRLVRNDVVAGLGALAKLSGGISTLAERVNDQIKRGTDANGKPIDIPLSETLLILQRYSSAVGRLADAVNTITGIDRVKANLPTAIVGIDVSGVTLEDAERQVQLAQDVLQRAKELGLASRAPHELGDEFDPTKH